MKREDPTQSAPKKQQAAKPHPQRSRFRAELFKQSRMLHAYLSAFAFIALIFFSLTGMLLNHPKWFAAGKPAGDAQQLTLPKTELAAAQAASEPLRALADAVGRQHPLRGDYASGEVLDGEAHIRLDGATGKSDLIVNLADGSTELTVQHASAATLIRNLHRGKHSGAAWSWLIDITAVVVFVLSVLGYVLFFSLRFRLANSIKLTTASLLLIGGIIYCFVP
ncbi:PepSY-associated TM helix domain-containing protein [Chitinivorax sp. PXF-14]|uniref:PepSY-associated TM helix domain-containing protein n=1 Tax=Chitinivorax sp. PXF-14 TaxID=3230488 RepID=UPI00346589BA